MIEEIKKDVRHRMDLAVESVRNELAKLRTGKASPAILDGLTINYYGTNTPLRQLANVSAPEPRLLVIQPWDRSLLGEIEKAILKSDLGLNPTNDGIVVRIPIPSLTEERRESLVKVAKKIAEEGRVAIRNVRRDANDKLKKLEKDHSISEDAMHRGQDEIQSVTDELVKKIDEILTLKETEILEV
ncbi:ribosome recycling factor [candidate division KSB1 bacterium]|nr:ribosome recycling factor [candidate division KSB1 bacterium]